MPKLIVVNRKGESQEFEGTAGLPVMQIIRDNGVNELMALCGGCCTCATCHVYVDMKFVALLPAIGVDENDLLNGSQFRKENSRLSCQILFTDVLDGLRVTIAPED